MVIIYYLHLMKRMKNLSTAAGISILFKSVETDEDLFFVENVVKFVNFFLAVSISHNRTT